MENIDFNNILKVIKPTKEENEKVKSLSDKLINIINGIANENNIDAEAVLVGSVAKGTWLSGKADVDIFIKFPLSTSEADLKKLGLELGHNCIEEMHGEHELRYASHPYITGFIEGFEIDFVPCYIIKSAEELKSAVDRTILHTEYVRTNLKEKQKDEVLLLKKFMGSIHTYSAEFKVGGFSGYLCELLIIHYGSFLNVLKAASKEWRPNYRIDIENYGTAELFSEPIVVIDPTDKNRNVAAALKLQ
ncbi:MAG TPA: CCA tRNA nucleotidyltransferase, partial [Methanobacterium sp.]|nr:CCA tRNA nucleotidyltransferase [Methanobacterium sp.]